MLPPLPSLCCIEQGTLTWDQASARYRCSRVWWGLCCGVGWGGRGGFTWELSSFDDFNPAVLSRSADSALTARGSAQLKDFGAWFFDAEVSVGVAWAIWFCFSLDCFSLDGLELPGASPSSGIFKS